PISRLKASGRRCRASSRGRRRRRRSTSSARSGFKAWSLYRARRSSQGEQTVRRVLDNGTLLQEQNELPCMGNLRLLFSRLRGRRELEQKRVVPRFPGDHRKGVERLGRW